MATSLWDFADDLCVLAANYVWEVSKSYLFHRRTQNNSICDSSISYYEKYEEDISIILEGSQVLLNSGLINSLNSEPEWLDYDKIKRGQEFGRNYFFSINYSNLISLYLLFSHERSLRPLIYTRKSNDVESAYKRYMSTIHRVMSWLQDDLSDQNSSARKSIRIVNHYHCSVTSELNAITETEYLRKSTLTNEKLESRNQCHHLITQDLQQNYAGHQVEEFLKCIDKTKPISQAHMLVTQFGFMGLVVLYPEKFGIYDLQEVESFIHLWKYLGYLLGIDDKYNLCTGSHDEVKRKCTVVLECILKPCLSQVDSVWEHMSICAFKGINTAFKGLVFETTLAFLLDCIDLKFDNFYNSMKFRSKIRFHTNKFLLKFVIPYKSIRDILNKQIIGILNNNCVFSRLDTNKYNNNICLQ